ncbi:MAG TPA: radical SAM protein [Gemmatimonadaceae bacterium]|nr:radical SAM protein [Gemmatimonadaceae bacterium]
MIYPTPQAINCSSIDVFLTYKCGLRCTHCFVGDRLNTNQDMDFEMFTQIVGSAHQWGTREITLLGGEPTLYPQIAEAVRVIGDAGFRARIVTNGQRSYVRFLESLPAESTPPFICFSIDGASPGVHDRIRGRGSYGRLIEAMIETGRRRYAFAAILSVSRHNAADVSAVLELSSRLGCEYVNIHHVTNRGFACPDIVLGIDEWDDVFAIANQTAREAGLRIRIEDTFRGDEPHLASCAVRDGTNLMFLPDGRVHSCMMFIDLPDSHSFLWSDGQLQPVASLSSERCIVLAEGDVGCPALRRVNSALAGDAQKRGCHCRCIYDKREVGADSNPLTIGTHESATNRSLTI